MSIFTAPLADDSPSIKQFLVFNNSHDMEEFVKNKDCKKATHKIFLLKNGIGTWNIEIRCCLTNSVVFEDEDVAHVWSFALLLAKEKLPSLILVNN
jgi:hypothetical protein